MNCPSDGTTLLMTERQGVEIDYCPQCRGVWLDRGELDKILDRAKLESEPAEAAAPQRPAPQQPTQQWGEQPQYQKQYEQSRDAHGSRPQQYQKRKKSPFEFLGDLFEG